MPNKRFRSAALTAVVVLLLGVGLAACGGGGDDEEADATTTTAAPATTTTTAPAFDPGGGDTTDTTTGSDIGDDQRAAIEDFMSNVQTDTGVEDTGEAYTYTTLTDDTGQLTVDAPAEWADVDGRTAALGTLTLPDVRASTDLEQYNATFDVPGFQFTATSDSTTGDPRAALNEEAIRFANVCEPQEVQSYSDPLYTGVSQVFANCGSSGAAFVWTAVQPIDTSDGDYIALVGVQILSDADVEALGHILDTFVVTPAG